MLASPYRANASREPPKPPAIPFAQPTGDEPADQAWERDQEPTRAFAYEPMRLRVLTNGALGFSVVGALLTFTYYLQLLLR
jgi:hypothetical protein